MILPVLLLALTAAGGPEVPVDTWEDRAADVAGIAAFDWLEPPALGEWSRRREGRLTTEDRVRDAIRAGLESVGVEQRPGDEADVLVGFELVPPDDPPRRRGALPRITRCGQLVGSAPFPVGDGLDDRLVVELVDPSTRLPIWKGSAWELFTGTRRSSRLRTPPEQELDETLRDAAAAILARLPRSGNADGAER